MLRIVVAAWFCLLLGAGSLTAQEWARKMFDTTEHDFGSVARASKQVFRFNLKNLYKEDVHVSGVRSSCGCTTPKILKPTLKTYETGQIEAQFNTRSFLGHRTATLTVTIDQPFFAEVQLKVRGNVRSDVVIYPDSVQFGSVNEGSEVEKKINVKYAGRDDWQLLDVQSGNPHFEVEVVETSRGGGRAEYQLLVRLKDDCPAGYLSDQLILVTNDHNSKHVPLAVEGRVSPAITVSPAQLYLGDVKPGEKVAKKLVVRGKSPFKIAEVGCSDGCFQFQIDQKSDSLYLVEVNFTADKPGRIQETINIRTEAAQGVAAHVVAYVNVVGSLE